MDSACPKLIKIGKRGRETEDKWDLVLSDFPRSAPKKGDGKPLAASD